MWPPTSDASSTSICEVIWAPRLANKIPEARIKLLMRGDDPDGSPVGERPAVQQPRRSVRFGSRVAGHLDAGIGDHQRQRNRAAGERGFDETELGLLLARRFLGGYCKLVRRGDDLEQ